METADELENDMTAAEREAENVRIQPAGYLLELSLDWIVLRASENVHHLLRESHVTLIDEPLGRFVHAQALHDLRNLFSKLSGTTGVGRAYAVRLTDDHDRVDIAFQLSDGRVLLEAVPSAGCFGECFGSVGGLIAGLANSHGQALLDGGARRMRALTGFDRVTLTCGERRAESSRGAFNSAAEPAGLPIMIADAETSGVGLYPRDAEETSVNGALMRALDEDEGRRLHEQGIRAMLRVPFNLDGLISEFCCESRSAREPNFELHAAAELFAQMFAMQLAVDQATNR
jgi:light-regulated signal transduction histidine kinase (bacteriophytochrome)